MATQPKYRYPGTYYFRKEDKDIFCGRKEDADKLFTQVMLSKTLVLHAESGTGKSSLIQAGFIPILESNSPDYLPVTLRFDFNKVMAGDKAAKVNVSVITDEIISKLKEQAPLLDQIDLPYVNGKADNLWLMAKKLAKSDKKLLFIFDQFEELQGFAKEQIDHFKAKLAELLSTDIPQSIYKEIRAKTSDIINKLNPTDIERKEFNDNMQFLEQPLKTKVIFVVREDKLGTMSLLSDYFPDILKNDFVIKALSIENARKAIIEPASLTGDFISPVFSFDNSSVVEKLLNELADPENQLIDPIQIQIVCSNIEKNAVVKAGKKNISESDIPPIGDIINDFYNHSWALVKEKCNLSEADFNAKRKHVITELVAKDHRNLVHSVFLIGEENKETDSLIIGTLVKSGLIREIPTGKDIFYQLCHDRFIKPINEDISTFEEKEKAELKVRAEREKIQKEIEIQKKEFEENMKEEGRKKKQKAMILFFSVIISLLLIFILYYRNEQKLKLEKEENDNILSIIKTIRKDNPTLSLVCAIQRNNDLKGNERFTDFISKFDSLDYTYLVSSFPVSSQLFGINTSLNNNNVSLLEENSISEWNLQKRMLEKQSKMTGGSYIKSTIINNQPYVLKLVNDSIEVQNREGAASMKFKAPEKTSIENMQQIIQISKNGKYIVSGENIYTDNGRTLLGETPHHESYAVPIYTCYTFLNDNIHLALGNQNGNILIYNLANGIRLSAVYNKRNSSICNYKPVTCLAVSRNDEFLVSVSTAAEPEVWKIDNLKVIDNLSGKSYQDSLSTRMNNRGTFRVLRGHMDKVISLAISPDGKTLLTGSNDFSAILWELRTGKKLSILEGRDAPVVFTAFSDEGNELITSTSDNIVFIWSREKASVLEKSHKLMRFSPFDYINVGLLNDFPMVQNIYDTACVTKLFGFTLNYIARMPFYNQYPDDPDYLQYINSSLGEIEKIYHSLLHNPHFENKDSISISNKALLYEFYNELKFRSATLRMETINEDIKSKNIRQALKRILYIPILLIDCSDTKLAIDYAEQLNAHASLTTEALNYSKSIYYLKNAIYLLDSFIKKHPDNIDLKNELISDYSDLANVYMFASKSDSAILFANKLENLKENDKADLIKIQVHLIKNQYDEAFNIFQKNETHRFGYETELSDSFRNWLKKRLTEMTDKKLNSDGISKMKDYLQI